MLYLLLMSLLPFKEIPFELPFGKWVKLRPAMFYRTTDGSKADYPTKVKLKADKKYLNVEFECKKDEFVKENYMTKYNEPLYKQEVFELFIAAGTDDPSQYLEFEINPNDAIWVGKIDNPSLGETNEASASMVGHDDSGIWHFVKIENDCWRGNFSIPWALISGTRQEHYRFNFCRIVSKKSHPKKDWECDTGNAEFLAWKPTMSGPKPAFHRPKEFGHLIVE